MSMQAIAEKHTKKPDSGSQRDLSYRGSMLYINFLQNFQKFKIVWNGEKIKKILIGFDQRDYNL